ncbi:unnamed protein product [Cyclocybe aegerita]|uniref:Uncharacterized protein n=1 Tax=Cyclocybe aegerita TaxID=1973307 RepID=A0A8S0XTP0_CYCAE|nr:unnamed protein product [Cyclocybe aegerita]
MKLSILSTFIFLVTLSTSVVGQAAFADDVDEVMARELDHDDAVYAREAVEDKLVLRGLEEVRRRSEDHLQFIERSLELLERRSKYACYQDCIRRFTGANLTNCYRKCDKSWGPHGKK